MDECGVHTKMRRYRAAPRWVNRLAAAEHRDELLDRRTRVSGFLASWTRCRIA
jgi:hypothetical protein